VYLHLHKEPESTVRRIADEVDLSERAVAMILADLRDDGYVVARKQGRRNVYALNRTLPMRHESCAGSSVGDFLVPLARSTGGGTNITKAFRRNE
jgi:DNA-binding transcriptional ArsR family regulator